MNKAFCARLRQAKALIYGKSSQELADWIEGEHKRTIERHGKLMRANVQLRKDLAKAERRRK